MIRALSYDKEGNVFVLDELESSWKLTLHNDAFHLVKSVLKSVPHADYQRLFPYPNGLGQSVMQRAWRLFGSELDLVKSSFFETHDFVSSFITEHWLVSYCKSSFDDYANNTLAQFSIPEKSIDDVVLSFASSKLDYEKYYGRLPLVNVLSLTFGKGYELEDYIMNNTPIIPNNKGLVYSDAYFFNSKDNTNVILPIVDPSENETIMHKTIMKNRWIVKAFLENNFGSDFNYHTLGIRDSNIFLYKKI